VLVAACLLLLAAPAFACPKTLYVHPSGRDDTANIQAAFNAAVKAGPGSTVQLSAGHFYTNRILVHNFKGCFRGAGQGKTFIDCQRGLDPSLPGVIVKGESDILPFPYLVAFDGGNVRVSDLSFDITAASPVDAAANGGSDFLTTIVFVTGNASSAFHRVRFTAGAGSDDGYNVDQGLVIAGYAPLDQNGNWLSLTRIRGVESVCGCSFAGHDGLVVQGLVHGRLTVSRSVFDDLVLSCASLDSGASQVTICHNQMSAASWDDIVLWQGFTAAGKADASLLPPLPAPHYLISHNRLLATGAAGGVEVRDDSSLFKAPQRLHAVIADNHIILDNGGWDAGIDGVYAKGIRVVHNRISGTGFAGIQLGFVASLWGMPSAPDSNWRIIGNDVSGVKLATQYTDASGAPLWGAQVWLGPDADHCLVVGGCKPTTVLNQGTDNTLINATPVTDPPAAAAMPMNAMKQLKHLKGMMLP
jgi:hypothetical protein